MNKLNSAHAFSLIEAVVAGVILTIAVTGVLVSLSSVQKPVSTNDDSMTAAYCGQQYLEDLRARVDSRDWGTASNPLTPASLPSTTIIAAGTLAAYASCKKLSDLGYAISMDFTVSDGGSGARKVQIRVNW